jgi:signal transduction histidine kinase
MELGIRPGAHDVRQNDVQHSLIKRLAWTTGLRLSFLVLLLGATAILYLRGALEQYPISLRIVFLTICVGFSAAAVYALVLRSGRYMLPLAWWQIAVDQVTWTAIVYVTGGPSSGATSFYGLTCLVGAVLVGLRGAAVAGALGVGMYALLGVALHFGWLPPPADQAATGYVLGTQDLLYPLLVNALGVACVAVLAGYLAERLRLTGGALQAATMRAYEAEQLAILGRIAAGLAHEIRNPLGSITGAIDMLREGAAISEEDRRLCDIVRREAGRLNELVGDMLDLAKPRRPPHAEATDVAALAREVVALAINAGRGSDVAVRYEGPSGQALARCDGAQLRQVLWNLVRNAIQASFAGTTVVVGVRQDVENVTLWVDDQGPGVPEAEEERIFEDFFTTRTKGAGLGLAVVRRIIDDHAHMGATLAVKRAPSGGASFRVTLSCDVAGLRKSWRPPAGGSG